MNLTKLYELAQQYKELEGPINELKAQKSKLSERIIKEMRKQKLKTFTGLGIRTTFVEPDDPKYNEVKAKKVLGSRFKSILRYSIDPKKLAHEVSVGNITVEEMNKFVVVKKKKASIRVSEEGADE